MHKSVQCTFVNEAGQTFEVQFQTPESQAAKNMKEPLYEERRQVGIDPDRAKVLENQMKELAEKVSDPADVLKIKSH